MKPIAQWTHAEKAMEAISRSVKYLPANARHQLERLLDKATLAIMAATLVFWAVSHFVGIGEVVDVVLLVVGAVTIGMEVFTASGALYDSAVIAVGATSEAELENSAKLLAQAMMILGINTVMVILARRSVKTVMERPAIRLKPMPKQGPVPKYNGTFFKPVIFWDASMPAGTGKTSVYGQIIVSSQGTALQKNMALAHELVHAFLSVRFGPLRQLRASLKASSYSRSTFLRYIEEAMAELAASLTQHGISFRALKLSVGFPVAGGYVTVTQLAMEAEAIGSILILTEQFTVYVFDTPVPTIPEAQSDPVLICE